MCVCACVCAIRPPRKEEIEIIILYCSKRAAAFLPVRCATLNYTLLHGSLFAHSLARSPDPCRTWFIRFTRTVYVLYSIWYAPRLLHRCRSLVPNYYIMWCHILYIYTDQYIVMYCIYLHVAGVCWLRVFGTTRPVLFSSHSRHPKRCT